TEFRSAHLQLVREHVEQGRVRIGAHRPYASVHLDVQLIRHRLLSRSGSRPCWFEIPTISVANGRDSDKAQLGAQTKAPRNRTAMLTLSSVARPRISLGA